MVDHIDYIAKHAGVDHVGIGSDYDGVLRLPEQLESVASYPLITQALLDRGYSKHDIHKILGGNVMRVLRESEKVSRTMEERIKGRFHLGTRFLLSSNQKCQP